MPRSHQGNAPTRRQEARFHIRAETSLVPDRNPDFEASVAGLRIEVLVIPLKAGCVGRFESGSRQPLIPDSVDGSANARDVITMAEHRVSLLGDANTTELTRQVGEVGYLDPSDVVEISGIIAVAADA